MIDNCTIEWPQFPLRINGAQVIEMIRDILIGKPTRYARDNDNYIN